MKLLIYTMGLDIVQIFNKLTLNMKKNLQNLESWIKSNLNFLNLIAILLTIFLIYGFFNHSVLTRIAKISGACPRAG